MAGLRRLGYERIKTEQLDAVESLLSGKDAFLSVPTRFGKSLVYQLLPFCAESLLRNRASPRHSPLVIVISPLLSLMYDQVAKLVAKGVKAVCISDEKPSNVFADAIKGRVTHVFGSPESLLAISPAMPCLLMITFLGKWWPWPLMKLTALLNGKSMNTHELLLQVLVY